MFIKLCKGTKLHKTSQILIFYGTKVPGSSNIIQTQFSTPKKGAILEKS